jgi:DNA-binding transcriptional regulator LsrR (DeoR family)
MIDFKSSKSITDINEETLMIIAAWMYYDSDLTQAQIAKELSISRTKVIRLLQKARSQGIVEIRLTRSLPIHFEMERQLKSLFHLGLVKVVNTGSSYNETLENIGKAGSDILENLLFSGCRIGFAWSETVSHMANYIIKPGKPIAITINEMAGTFLGPNTPYGISWRVAEKLGVPLDSMPVPVLVENEAARKEMLKDKRIGRTLSNAGKVDIAFVGLGNMDTENSLARAGYLSAKQIKILQDQGIVGDILMRFYDANGNSVSTDLDQRIISVQWDTIREIPTIIAMAAGQEKIRCILGALKGRFIHGLVTDMNTAHILINEAHG